MNKTYSISVVMSVFNEPVEWMQASIESILAQTFSDFEFLIVNDNPLRTENKEVLANYAFKDKRVSIIENAENIGLTKSLNRAIRLSLGKYIARMDADDISLPKRFEKQFEYMQMNPTIMASGTWMEYFGIMNKPNKEYRCICAEVKDYLLINPPISHPTAIIRREVFFEHGVWYNEGFRFSQDYELFFQISKIGELGNLPEILLKYRTTVSQISSKNLTSQTQIAIQLRKEILVEMLGGELVEKLGLLNIENSKTAWRNLTQYIKHSKHDNTLHRRLNVLKYVLLMSPTGKHACLFHFFILATNPFQQIGFSKRYYLKALSNQLFLNYKPLL